MDATSQQPSALLDRIIEQQRMLAAAQARLASLMIEFCDERRRQDERLGDPDGSRPSGDARPAEFAVDELAMALSTQATS